MNKRRRFKAKRRRHLQNPECQYAFKAARYLAMYGASINRIMRELQRYHKYAGLSQREVENHLKQLKLYL